MTMKLWPLSFWKRAKTRGIGIRVRCPNENHHSTFLEIDSFSIFDDKVGSDRDIVDGRLLLQDLGGFFNVCLSPYPFRSIWSTPFKLSRILRRDMLSRTGSPVSAWAVHLHLSGTLLRCRTHFIIHHFVCFGMSLYKSHAICHNICKLIYVLGRVRSVLFAETPSSTI